jgi:hypothetical protein
VILAGAIIPHENLCITIEFKYKIDGHWGVLDKLKRAKKRVIDIALDMYERALIDE